MGARWFDSSPETGPAIPAMSCVYFPCPSAPVETLADVTRAAGQIPIPEAETRLMPRFEGPVFICGKIKPEPVCRCGHSADFLCDQPVGGGKTCDLPLCWCCRTVIGEDYDLCPVHAATWSARAPAVQQELFKGPRRP